MVENSGIAELPPSKWFQAFNSIEIALDNSPTLSRLWEAMSGSISTATIKWNKIWPDMVQEGLYLGSLRTAQNKEVFDNLVVTHVLTCGRNMQTQVPSGVEHMQIEVEDNEVEDLAPHFDRAVDFIRNGVAEGSVLIHWYAAPCLLCHRTPPSQLRGCQPIRCGLRRLPHSDTRNDQSASDRLCEDTASLNQPKPFVPRAVGKVRAKNAAHQKPLTKRQTITHHSRLLTHGCYTRHPFPSVLLYPCAAAQTRLRSFNTSQRHCSTGSWGSATGN